nr:CIH_HP1_G0052100.mRNA.1.CDS.1 [Saccharomyces cerevisiae]
MRFHRQGTAATVGVLLIVLLGFCWKLSESYGIVSLSYHTSNLQPKSQTHLLYDGIITMSLSETLILITARLSLIPFELL